MSSKQLWLLVGGNGAGKSTFFELFLRPRGLAFVNADRIARTLAPEGHDDASYEAAVLAERMFHDLLAEGLSFCFETVFSHVSKIDLAGRAKARGYQIILVLIHLDDPALNLARISQRVDQGGHDVPEHKVRSRLPRTLKNVASAMALADEVHLVDNSSAENPFRRVAVVQHGEAQLLSGPTPDWAHELFKVARAGSFPM